MVAKCTDWKTNAMDKLVSTTVTVIADAVVILYPSRCADASL